MIDWRSCLRLVQADLATWGFPVSVMSHPEGRDEAALNEADTILTRHATEDNEALAMLSQEKAWGVMLARGKMGRVRIPRFWGEPGLLARMIGRFVSKLLD